MPQVISNLEIHIARTGETGGRGLNVFTRSLRRLREASAGATGKLGKLLGALKRVAFYRVIRAVIKSITDEFQEGLKNAYAYSELIGSCISQSLDRIASAHLKMRNQLGAAFGELISTVEPIIIAIINLVTKAADAVSQFFAVLGGRSTYHKALDSSKKWAEETNKGAKAAKEWKNQLLGFDVINRLEDTRGSDTGNNDDNNIGNWELAPVTMEFPWLDKIKELIASIDFEPLKKAIKELGDAFKRLGNTIGKAISWAWDNVLAPFIKWFIEKALPAFLDLSAAIVDFANVVLERLGPVFQEVWNNVLKPFFSWLGNEFVFIFQRLAEIVREFSRVISGEIDFKTFWDNLSTSEKILLAIIGVIAAVAAAAFLVSHPFLTLAAVVALVANYLVQHWDIIKAKWDEVVGKIKGKIDEWKAAWDAFADRNMEKSEELRATLWEKIEAIKEFFEGLKEKWNDVKETIALKIDELHQKWKDFKAAVSEKIERIKEFFQNLKDKWDEVVEGVRTKIEEAKDFLQGLEDKVGNVKDAVVGFFNGMWSGITGAINSIIGGIQSIISWCQNAISWLKKLISWKNSAGSSGGGSGGSGGSGYSNSGSSGGTTVNSRGFSGTSGKFAEGGFPEEGQLFLAREAGPELVGTIGGQTAVANNPDIVAAIEGGVYRAMTSVMSSAGSSRSGGIVVFNVNGREFMRAIWDDRNAVIAEHGVSLVTNG